MREAVTADDNRNQACDFGDRSSEKGLREVKPVSNGEPLCAKAATGTKTRMVAIDTDFGNLRIHFRCLGERFMGSSISANSSTPHKQVVGTD